MGKCLKISQLGSKEKKGISMEDRARVSLAVGAAMQLDETQKGEAEPSVGWQRYISTDGINVS